MLTICLLALVVVLSIAVIVLFHQHMVNLSAWHLFTHGVATKAANDVATLKAYVETHLHLHTAPATTVGTLAAPGAAAKK